MAVGGVYVHPPNAPARVAEHLPFAPIDPLVGVEAPLLTQARGQLDALRIDQRQRRGGQAVTRQPVGPVSRLVESLQQAGGLPAGKIVVHRRPGRKTSRQAAPLAAREAHVAQGVNDLAQTQAPLPLQGQQGRNNLPLRVSEGLIAPNHKANRSLGTPTATYWLVSFCPTQFPNTLLDPAYLTLALYT